MTESDLNRDELHRYARHIALPEVGLEGQACLKSSRVLCVGAGGLGSPATLYLAAAGVGTLGIVDFDSVDMSNLQRQILHGTNDVGRSKLDSAEDKLLDVNPFVEIVKHEVQLSSENALEVLRGYDVVIDGTDNFPARYLVNDACVLAGIPNIYGSVFRWEGQVSVFATRDGPCYRCLFREPPPPGLVPNCAEGGVLGVLPGIIGSIQAMETVKLLLGVGHTLAGRLLIFDSLEMSWREVRLRKNPDCPVCSDQPSQRELIDYEVFCGLSLRTETTKEKQGEIVDEIAPEALAELLRSVEPPFLIDVRDPWEWGVSNLAEQGARLIPVEEIEARISEIPRGVPVVVYCRSGKRGLVAASLLKNEGYRRVFNLSGGILRWAESVDPGMPVV